VDRLVRIEGNLKNTLDVCLRARAALERREALPPDLPANLNQVITDSRLLQNSTRQSAPSPVRRGSAPELSPLQRMRLQQKGPVRPEELKDANFDDLARKLQGF